MNVVFATTSELFRASGSLLNSMYVYMSLMVLGHIPSGQTPSGHIPLDIYPPVNYPSCGIPPGNIPTTKKKVMEYGK